MTRQTEGPDGVGISPAGQPAAAVPAAQPAGAQLTAGQPAPGQPGGDQPGPAPAASGQRGSGRLRRGKSGRRAGDPWRAAFLCVLAAAVVIGAAWALLGSSLLVVRHIEVIGNHQVTSAQVRHQAGIKMGTPLARLSEQRITARVDRIPWVKSASVTRSWPDTVVIRIHERTPELAVASGGQFELVDVTGIVVRTQATRPSGVPLLASPPARLRDSPAIRAAVSVLGSLPGTIRHRVTSVTTTTTGVSESVTLRLRSGVRVLWGGTGRSAAKARELESLMRTKARYYDVSSPSVAVTAR
jgi:cell division protein FtsQ